MNNTSTATKNAETHSAESPASVPARKRAKRPRKKISDSTRFEVFKRDLFKCQYCGRCAPEIVLELDHVDPHSKGGSDDVMNLVTSCRECNSGKSDRAIGDDSVLAKQRSQLEELAERREQIEMMMRWRSGLEEIRADEATAFLEAFAKRTRYALNETAHQERKDVEKLVRVYGLARCLDAMDRSIDQYARYDKNGVATAESIQGAFRAIWVFVKPEADQQLYLVRAIVRNKLNDAGNWCSDFNWKSMAALKAAVSAGVDPEDLRLMALGLDRGSTYRHFERALADLRGE